MTPKEKAKKLYNRYAIFWHDTTDNCKNQCLIVIDEIITVGLEDSSDYEGAMCDESGAIDWWKEVKQEIEKL